MKKAEASLTYTFLKVEPVTDRKSLWFEVQNIGNADIELLRFEVHLPRSVIPENYWGGMMGMVSVSSFSKNGIDYLSYYCYSNRGECGTVQPILPSVITPSMEKIRPDLEIPIRLGLNPSERDLPIFFQIHAIAYRTEREERRIADIPEWK